MSDREFERVLRLARQAETLRLQRVAATGVRRHRSSFSLPRRAAALVALVILMLSAGPALLVAGSGEAATTVGDVVAAHLPRTAWVCCGATPPRAPVAVEAVHQTVRAAPKAVHRSPGTPTASPSPSPRPTPARVVPVVRSTSPSPSPSVSPSTSPSPSQSPSSTPSPLVSLSAGAGCALPPP